MNKAQAEDSIKVIREIMEKSARYTTFSGLSGVVAGLLALSGCAATYWINKLEIGPQQYWMYVAVWVVVLILAMSQDFALSQRKARKLGDTIFNKTTYQVLRAAFPGVFLAFVLSVRALTLNEPDAIPALWTLGYGVGGLRGRYVQREGGQNLRGSTTRHRCNRSLPVLNTPDKCMAAGIDVRFVPHLVRTLAHKEVWMVGPWHSRMT